MDLNLAWLNKLFKVDLRDVEMLNVVEALITQGADVYFAIEHGIAVATCMFIPRDNRTWEICKLATAENYQGNGAGSAVLKACMEYERVNIQLEWKID